MEFEVIKGLRRNSKVVWTPEEKYLYARQCERSGKTEYICYQKILYDQYIVKKNAEKMEKNNKKKSKKNKKNKKKSKKNKSKEEKKDKVLNCTARVKIDKMETVCSRNNVSHSRHHNHENIYKEMVSKNAIIDKCIEFKKVTEGLPLKVPASDIFTLEMSK